MQISLSDQIKCVEREIDMRRRVYPRRVINKTITEGEKDREIAAMQAVLNTLVLFQRCHLHHSFNRNQEK